MLKIFASVSVAVAALVLAAPQAPAQQVGVIVDAPGEVDPTSQGWVVYRGVPFPPWSGYFLLCQNPQQSGSGDLVPAGEVAEDVHMLQSGDLASVTFTYRVWSQSRGGSGPASGAATATLNVYANDATDTTLPSAATLLGTWTIPLTWEDDVWYVVSYDIPVPISVPRDLWVGIEIDSPDGTAGGLGGKGALSTETGAIQLGESHNLSWLGVSACEPAGRLVSNFEEFGIVGNYGVDVRVFPVVDCEFPVADGDFETGQLGAWSALGRGGVVTAEQVSLATASGAWQAAVTNGDAGGDIYYGNPALPGLSGLPASASDLEAFLGLAAGTLSGLAAPNAAVEGSAIKQTLTVHAGDRLRFHWSFLTNEESPAPDYNDLAFVSISTGSTSLLADTLDPDLIDSLSVHGKETGYRTEEIELTTSGTVTVGFGVVDQGDAGADASLLVDCVELVPGPGGNQPPTCTVDLAAAAADFLQPSPGSFVVTEGETIVVAFVGSDPDGDLLMVEANGLPEDASLAPLSGDSPLTSTFSWTPTATDKSGAPYVVTVTFRDPAQASSSCGVTVEDVNLRPICSVADVTVDANGLSGSAVTLSGSVADADDPVESLVTTWFVAGGVVELDDPSSLTPSGLFPVGSTDVTLCVVDGRGGWSECTATVTVLDAASPEVACSTDTSALWPPKHGMHAVTVVVSATQGQAQLPISVLVSSSEPDDAAGNGDGQTTGDVHGQDGYGAPVDVTSSFSFDAQTGLWSGTVMLRAEREGAGVGRKYTIDVSAVDGAGGSATTSCCVVVPHDRRKSSAP